MKLKKKVKAKWRLVRNSIKLLKLNFYKKKYDKRLSDDNFDAKKIKRILLLRWDNKLGDAIMCGGFISLLKKYRPDIHISVLTGNTTKEWLEKSSPADEYIIYNKSNLNNIIKEYAGKFDLFVDLGTHYSHKDLYVSSRLQASHYMGFNKEKYNLFDVNIDARFNHFKERYSAAAQLLISKEIDFPKLLPVPDFSKELKCIRDLIDKIPHENVVAINLFGSGKYRKFSFNEAKHLLEKWRKEYPEDLLVIIPTPNEEKFISSLLRDMNDPRVISPAYKACFEMSLAIIDIADFTFTPDTAVVHMGTAIDKPIIGVYRYNMQNYEEWKPLAKYSQSIINRKPYFDNDSVYVHEFKWKDLEQAREYILKALI
ncbi:hypothetical protein C0W44_13370 [Photobacterium leiognathi subsp. mandapamensis]|nr:hypothetical protein C0W44_13370 [Photobacterium leiognathi subsp. mandapamensis]